MEKNEVRPAKLNVGSITLELPSFFPSVSTVKTMLKPLDYVRFLNAMGSTNRQYLVSAFDLFHADDTDQQQIKNLLKKSKQAGCVVLMDSGNYESFWREVGTSWEQSTFHQVLREYDCSIAFSFDHQNSPNNFDDHVSLICENYAIDKDAKDCEIIPIIHGSPELLPRLCSSVAIKTGTSFLAVPERRLGEGIYERVSTLIKIRKALNEICRYVKLHLLGTGNPLSISIYSIYGADTFDGLEWCQTVVDHRTSTLFHFSQADFFMTQTDWGTSGLPFQMRVLAHNLDFYVDWMKRLRQSLDSGLGIDFCQRNFPRNIYTRCSEILGW